MTITVNIHTTTRPFLQTYIREAAQSVLSHQFLQHAMQYKYHVIHTMHLWFAPIFGVAMQEGG